MNYKNEVQLVFNDKLHLGMYELLNMPSIFARFWPVLSTEKEKIR